LRWCAPEGGSTEVACGLTSSLRPRASFFRDQRHLSVAILLTYATAPVLLADDTEVREEEYMVSGSYARP
jgi:hypothetical protein